MRTTKLFLLLIAWVIGTSVWAQMVHVGVNQPGTLNQELENMGVDKTQVTEDIRPDGYQMSPQIRRLSLTAGTTQELVFNYNPVITYAPTLPLDTVQLTYIFKYQATRVNMEQEMTFNSRGTRVGEYLWSDVFNFPIPAFNWWNLPVMPDGFYPLNTEFYDLYMNQIHMEHHFRYNATFDEFTRYYGRYITPANIGYLNDYSTMYEGVNKEDTGWEIPDNEDYRQHDGIEKNHPDRGFYVQHVLNSPNPATMDSIMAYAKRVDDNALDLASAETRRGQVQEEANRMEEMQSGSIKALSVYPNPVTDVLNIDSEEPIVSVKVYSSTGALVVRTEAITNSFDVSSLMPGIYTVVVQTEKENATFRVVKK